jgi:hypothetical protein
MDSSDAITINSISPKNGSPSSKVDLIINGTNFGTDKTLIKCYLVGINKTYDIPIFKITDTSITAVLLGGLIGNYTVKLISKTLGYNLVDTTLSSNPD